MTTEFLRYLAQKPICTRCGINPHTTSSQWCHACINEKAKERRLRQKGSWYHRMSEQAWTKRKIRNRVWNKIKRQTVTKKPCQVCGKTNSQAHHHNGYEEKHAFDLVWLCPEHHREAEKKLLTGLAVK